MADILAILHASALGLWLRAYSNGQIDTSPDGLTYGAPTTVLSGAVRCLGFDGTTLVAAGDAGALSTSTDGVAWTSRTSGFGADAIRGVAYSSSLALWVSVGDNGKLYTSPTATTWTAGTSGVVTTLYCATFANGFFVVGGDAGKLLASSTGSTWTARAPGFGAIAGIRAVCYSTSIGLWLATGDLGHTATSPDTITWTARAIGFLGTQIGYAAAATTSLLIVGGSSGGLASSPDGITWTLDTAYFGSSDIYALAADIPGQTLSDLGVIHPTLQSYSLAPTIIDPGNGLGQRASIRIQIADEPWADLDVDPYVSTRSYDPFSQGTYWGKFLARNPYYQNRELVIYTGFLVGNAFDPANCQASTFLLDQIAGPDNSQKVSVTARDALKLADDKKALAPSPNTGKLLTDITDVSTAIVLTPALIGDAEYPLSGTVCIGSECITFTRVAGSDTLTVVNRATDHTIAASASAGAAVQLCLRYTNVQVQKILLDLLVNYGNVPNKYINSAAWDLEANTWLSTTFLTTLIPKPVGVTTLIKELSEQCLFFVWWDEHQSLIQFQALHPARGSSTSLTDSLNFLANSPSIAESPDQRLSEVFVYYGQVNPTLDVTRTDNYTLQQIQVDLQAEQVTQYGEAKIKQIFSRWFKANNQTQAATLGTRLLSKYRDNPRTFTFQLDAKDASLWTGDFAQITSYVYQDTTGASTSQGIQIVSAQENVGGTTFTYKAVNSFFTRRYGYITPNSMPVYSLASAAQKSAYGFISQNNGLMLNGDTGYAII